MTVTFNAYGVVVTEIVSCPDSASTRSVGPRRPWRRGLAWALGSVIATAVILTLAGLPLYVFPPGASVSDTDLVYIIGPAREPRIELAEELLSEHPGAETLVSVSPSEGPYQAKWLDICAQRRAVCETPDPFTTKGEAELLNGYTATHLVRNPVVITYTPHVARTRFIFDKCFNGEATVVGVDESLSLGDWIYQYVYQTAAFARAWATPCA